MTKRDRDQAFAKETVRQLTEVLRDGLPSNVGFVVMLFELAPDGAEKSWVKTSAFPADPPVLVSLLRQLADRVERGEEMH